MKKTVWDLVKIVDDYSESVIKQALKHITLPIPIEDIIKHYGINIELVPMPEEQSGAIVINQDTAGMIINKNDAYCRQRFTMAHEFGHFVSCRYQNTTDKITEYKDVLEYRRDENSKLGRDSEEIFANKFAAAILMPRSVLLELRSLSIEELAVAANVSTQAMQYRLDSLKIY